MRSSAVPALLVAALFAGCSPAAAPEEREPAAASAPADGAPDARTPDAGTAGGDDAGGAVFQDVTDDAGLRFVHQNGATGRKYLPEIMGAGVAVLDYDGDGRMDLFFVQSGAVPGSPAPDPAPGATHALYRNLGDGTFEDVTEATGIAGGGDRGYGMGTVAGDYDEDGDPDLYVVHLGDDVLYRNEGDGTFIDVTAEAGITSPLWGSSAAFFDAEPDGDLDLFVVNYLDFTVKTHVDCGTPSKGILSYCHPDVYEMAPDAFFRNRGDGTFEDATAAVGIVDTTGKGLGVVAAELTGDRFPDVYVANDSTPNFLFAGTGGGRFEEAGLFWGVGYNEEGLTEAGMGVDAGDVDADGDLDLVVTNLNGESNSLYLGGSELFGYASRQSGLYEPSFRWVGFGVELADLDNDADLDVVVTNGHVIDNVELIDDAQTFRQPGQILWNEGERFREASAAELGALATPRVGRALAAVDVDDDGRLDLVVTYNNDRARLFRNRRAAGSWIGFALRGTASNRDAVGARVVVEAGGRAQLGVRLAGSSYQSSADPRLHFGLGDADRVERVTVTWPSGAVETFDQLETGRYHRLVESSSGARQ